MFTPFVIRQPGVVWQCDAAFFRQPLRCGFHFFTRQAVYDSGITRMLAFDKPPHSIAGILAFADGVANIGSIKTVHENPGVTQIQLRDNFPSCTGIGGGCQGDARYAGESFM